MPPDHPRICGEKTQKIGLRKIRKGSPPHMRGKAAHSQICLCYLGITPAYAGKRNGFEMKTSKHRDHPRICGEKGDLIPIYLDEVGSPPHMRGKVFKNFHHDSDSGITPAYAGKSLLCQLQVLVCKDHPRICGEKSAECS